MCVGVRRSGIVTVAQHSCIEFVYDGYCLPTRSQLVVNISVHAIVVRPLFEARRCIFLKVDSNSDECIGEYQQGTFEPVTALIRKAQRHDDH